MAPAPRASLAPRRTTQAEHIYELGVVGRKTGVTVPDSGVRDEHGMEPLENLFSSPGKSDQSEERDDAPSEEDDGNGEAPMDITTTSGFGPAALLNGHGNRLPMPLPRVRSPVKTLLKSPAQRNRLLARNSSSPARGALVRDGAEKSSSQPVHDQAASKRRLDFRSVETGGPHSLSQPTRGLATSHRLQPLQQESDEGSEQGAEYDEVNDFVEESMAMLNGGDEDGDPQAAAKEDEEAEEEISMVDEGDPDPPALKARGRPPKQSEISAKPAKPPQKPARQVVEEEGSEDAQSSADEEEEIPATAQHKPGPNGRGRPPKAGKGPAAEQPQARGSKKRRSLGEEESAAAREPSPEPQPKRQRTEPTAARSKKPTTDKPPEPAPKKAAAPAPSAKPKGPGRKRKSSTDADAVVAAARRPPLPKSRGLLINRREAPGDSSSSMFRTRSGRTSFKPLAYWRNERVDYEKDEAEDVVDSSRARNRSRFVLPSIKEVVRVDEPEVEVRSRKPSSRSKGGKGKGKGKRRRGSYGYDDEDDDDDEPADLWELDPGTVTGEVVVWQPEYEFRPPAPNDLVSVMDKQLAISGRAIKTTEVVGGEFRYAKVFSEGFIGAGVVDLPPGAIKRLKNSRKVFMIFFVHVGRVLVTVQETSFRIGKGGIFIVPRYNEYTIENDYDHPARIFFSQGQETVAQPPPEEEGEHAGDEEVEVSQAEEEGSEEGD